MSGSNWERFYVLPDNGLVVRDSVAERNLHCNSRPEATELCALLNGFVDAIREEVEENARLRKKIEEMKKNGKA